MGQRGLLPRPRGSGVPTCRTRPAHSRGIRPRPRNVIPHQLRRRLNGIVWKFRTGTAWRDVPERYGPWATLHTRFRRWALDGTFERMLRAAQARADA
ncbi:hypothetical protein CIB93_34205, partial [Streptomyces sp. WZ.A104]